MAKINLGNVIGPQGPVGPQGQKGETGEKGKDATINGFSTTEIVGTNDANITTDENGIITVDVVTPKKISDLTNDSNFAKTNENNNFSTSQTVNGTLTINGDIIQNGQSYESHAEELFTKNDLIKTRDGAIGGLSDGEYTGIEAINYDGENNGQLVFDNTGTARVGDKNDTQPLLTRDEIANLQDGQVFVWDGTNLKAVGSSEYVKNTDYATNNKAGLVKANVSYGLYIGTAGNLTIKNASNADIDEKTQIYRPIVPSTSDYAVKSSITTNTILLTDEEKTSAQNWLGFQVLTQTEYDALETKETGVFYFIEEEV